jgi:hypothetical protein
MEVADLNNIVATDLRDSLRRREHWLATSRAVCRLGTYVLHVGRSSTDRPARSRFGSAAHHILRIGHKRGRSRQ